MPADAPADPVGTGAPLADLVHLVAAHPRLAGLAGRPDASVAVPEAARAAVVSAVGTVTRRRCTVVVTPGLREAEMLAESVSSYLGPDRVHLFPPSETLPFERVSPSPETMGRRAEVIWKMSDPDRRPALVVVPVRAAMQRIAPSRLRAEPVRVVRGGDIDLEALVTHLVRLGYRREQTVEHRGEFAVRGAICDVFPAQGLAPVRIDTWGDEVERLSRFDVDTQRSTGDVDELVVFAAREFLVDDDAASRASALVGTEPWGREHWERLAEGQVFDGMESWLPWLVDDAVAGDGSRLLDLVDDDCTLVILDPSEVARRGCDVLEEEADLARALARTWNRDPDLDFPRLHLDPDAALAAPVVCPRITVLSAAQGDGAALLEASGWAPVIHDPSPIVGRMTEMLGDGWTLVISADTDGSARRLSGLVAEHGLSVEPGRPVAPGAVTILTAPGVRGFSMPAIKVAVVAEADLTGRRRTRHRRLAPAVSGASVFEDLRPGGYVVHHHHGVGRYEGMVTRAIGGVERDYLLLAYKGADRLYVPVDQIHTVRQYVGGDAPALNKLGGADFAKVKSRVRSAVREIAQELVVLYQRRVSSSGHAFAPDTPWQTEMESSFPWVETPDQLAAIEAVKADMERDVPMDRLLCGDVGFGKTEVAVRAAFKAVQDGRQVAVLVPTTLLASQHGLTFAERFAGYPVRVEVLSRFQSAAEAKAVIDGLATGDVDVVIGTHRLLQGSVTFKNLGLLIVDEEQRFGVQHKEAVKRLRADVDALTMSATPIPRTLEMSLVGIRDLSLLQTPPADRQPILTWVGPDSENVAVEAIRRELLREGQVFWVHNRVQTIEDRARQLRELVPEARVAVAHGQMDEAALEQVVMDFWEGSFDVLVCTTIIESGIDMPAVNTLVVERADLLGLGQLHQLRGRVGRGNQRAYAYLFHPPESRLGEQALERLRTIGEAVELGSGFKIAMRDLEIRGAGNLLGESQSGHISAVGYDLYCEMVLEAVGEMKGETPELPSEIVVDLPVDAHLPVDYVPSEEDRLEAYRRLVAAREPDAVEDVAAEWTDRFGPPPEPAEALIAIARLRALAAGLGITEIVVAAGKIRIAPVRLRAGQEMTLRRLARDGTCAGLAHDSAQSRLTLPLRGPRDAPRTDLPGRLVAMLRELFDDD
jgi:transcription-repair coupling factor (superfamily II helicase)